jgi:hypothetical protein
VLNLRDVFQLGVDRFNDGPLSQQQLVWQWQQAVLLFLRTGVINSTPWSRSAVNRA